METKANHTLRLLMEEIGSTIPDFKVGQIYITIKSLYPTYSAKNKNIVIDNKTITKPLACSKKSKEWFRKDKSILYDFFQEKTKGDFLKGVKEENNIAYCENISLKKEIKEKYYKDELIKITKDDILNNNVKLYKRNITKFFI
jgi:hypothetical protein